MSTAPDYAADEKDLARGRVVRYVPTADGVTIPYARAIELWRQDAAFRSFVTNLLAKSSFEAFRWETPGFSTASADRRFEFVLVDTPGFATRTSDAEAFAEHFTAADVTTDDIDTGIVAFDNLGRDATLVVPCPRADASVYGHLAAFVRGAPTEQVDALWRSVGLVMAEKSGNRPIWLSTAGGGVAWLHVRLDRRPKYYAHEPYARIANER